MNTVSRTISGVAILIIGGFVLYLTLTEPGNLFSKLWGLGWGGLLCGLAVYLFLNDAEDKIEEITESKEE